MILRAPEHRFQDRLLWQHPVLLEGEMADHAAADRRIELGASCGACGRPLAYPLVQLPCGGRSAPLLHPECAESLAEAIMRDLEEIDDRKEGF